MDPITWAKVGQTALALGKRFWYVVPIMALAVALVLTRGTLASTKADLSAANTYATQLEERNQTTQTSLDGALSRIKTLNADAEAAAKRYQDDRERAAAQQAALQTRYQTTAARVTALEASSRSAPVDPCKPSALALDALKDL